MRRRIEDAVFLIKVLLIAAGGLWLAGAPAGKSPHAEGGPVAGIQAPPAGGTGSRGIIGG